MNVEEATRPRPASRGAGNQSPTRYDSNGTCLYCKREERGFGRDFPDACPLAADHPLVALTILRDQAWAAMHPFDDQLAESIYLLKCHDKCAECVARHLASPLVKRLRSRRAVPGAPHADRSDVAERPRRRSKQEPVYVS